MSVIAVNYSFAPPPPLDGVAGELERLDAPMGHKSNWRSFLDRADDDLLDALKKALRCDGSVRDSHLISACCETYDGMGRFLSKKGGLKSTAERFAYHAIATVDFCVTYSNSQYGVRRHKDATMLPMQQSFYVMSPPRGKRYKGALSENEMREARVLCLAFFAKDHRDDNLDPDVVDFILSNYDGLMEYASVIIEQKDTSRHFLEGLLEMQPSPALIGGML